MEGRSRKVGRSKAVTGGVMGGCSGGGWGGVVLGILSNGNWTVCVCVHAVCMCVQVSEDAMEGRV